MMQPWWMDAVCAGQEWDVMLISRSEIESGKAAPVQETDASAADEVVAAMPYLLRKRLGVRFVVMPHMTMFGGMWLTQDVYGSPDMQERLGKLFAKKLRGLGVAFYCQQFPAGNPMPYWLKKRGFKVREQILHLVNSDGETVVMNPELKAEEFYRFHSACLKEQGRKPGYTREDLLVLERKCSRIGKSCFVQVRDAQDELQAAAFLVWDVKQLYPLQWCVRGENKDVEALLNRKIMSKARELGVPVLYSQSSAGQRVTSNVVSKYTNLWLAPIFYFAYRGITNPFAK